MLNEKHNLIVSAKLRAANFNRGMKGMDARIRSFSGSIVGLQGALIALPFAAVGVSAVKAASELESAERRFKISFGNLQEYGSEFQESITNDLGRTRGEIISSMVSFKQFFQGLGFATSSAAMLSKKMAGLSIDLAAFFNLTDQQASKRFLAALAGSPEVLDQFGINLKEAAVRQELLNMGITVGVQRASEFQKTIARLNIIDRVMGKNGLVGFAINNTDLFSNRMKELQGRVKALSISFGKELLPIASTVVTKLAGFAKTLSEMSKADKQKIITLAAAIGALPLAISALANATVILRGFFAVLGGGTASILAAVTGFYLLNDAIEKYNKLNFISDEEKSLLNQLEGTTADEKIASINKEISRLTNEGFDPTKWERIKNFVQVSFGGENLAQEKVNQLNNLKMSLEAGGDEFLNMKSSTEALSESLKGSFSESLSFVTDKFKELTDKISESLFSGKSGKIDPMGMIEFTSDQSIESDLVDRVGLIMLNARARLEDIAREMGEFKGTKIVYDAGRRIGMAFGDGIVVAMDEVQSLVEGIRDVLATSITGVFEGLGALIANGSTDEFKKSMLGVLGSAFTAVGSAFISFGVGLIKAKAAAMSLNAPAVIAAGGALVALGAGISATARKEFGGTAGTASSAQFIGSQLTGQTSFGQVLTAEVDYDKLRFVFQNGQSRSFRTNG